MEAKKFCAVIVIGATVWFHVKDKRVGFVDTERLIHWMDFEADKQFSRMKFNEGQVVWLYWAKDANKLVSVMYSNNEKTEDLPAMEPIEV